MTVPPIMSLLDEACSGSAPPQCGQNRPGSSVLVPHATQTLTAVTVAPRVAHHAVLGSGTIVVAMTLVCRCALALAITLLVPTRAVAGGLDLPFRGVHELERAGALVADAADADALFVDPAGLAHLAGNGKQGLLFDIAYVYQPVTYTPIGTPGRPAPAITNEQPGAAAPTVAATLGIRDRWVLAAGFTSPYYGGQLYEPTGVQRYASVAIDLSLVQVAVGAAYVVSPHLRIGGTIQDYVSRIHQSVAVSMCSAQLACSPQDASYDAVVTNVQTGYLSPTASVGAQWDATPNLVVGGAVQGPTYIWGSGTLTSTLPTNSQFQGAQVVGNSGETTFWLPPIVRAGASWHPTAHLAIEAALDVELWSVHSAIDLTPSHVAIQTPTSGPQTLQAMQIARDYHTSVSPSLGAELHVGVIALAAGVAYETAAAPASTVSVLTVDANKLIIGLGGGYDADGWQIGAAVGYAYLANVDVSASAARVVELQPLRTTPLPDYVNAGTYSAYDLIAGLRAARAF
jgi:long-subunit fatty acid transport protein